MEDGLIHISSKSYNNFVIRRAKCFHKVKEKKVNEHVFENTIKTFIFR